MVDDLEDVLQGYPDFIGKDEPLGSFVSDPSAGWAGVGDVGLLTGPERQSEIQIEILMNHKRVTGSCR